MGTTVAWPRNFTAATGDSGVATAIASTRGAIGYVSRSAQLKITRDGCHLSFVIPPW
ncbi:hypothetical protein LC605_26845 [Nostoc sp. CHAB 5836]|uniref:hypothetical protein n=1 Tax=Nostoc sp. CHAB 5836 TaxID=2780404 RepID=UPI001E448AB4|nr:hypothetical protein [Nostoc sp. CHAB 5836]MCC5618643.1 hypothetical protein [Nostoc sp. CHAB 5836]